MESSFKSMPRSYQEPPPPFPRTTIKSDSFETGGVTMSHENSKEEAAAELNILKAILNREGYLNRVLKSSKSVNRKFKPEIADLLDLIRASGIQVVEAILKWREVKKDHDAAYFWNDINYLLKMPSDIDFLVQYKAIEDFIGFGLKRNPFIVPYPLESGATLHADLVLNPKGIEDGNPEVDGMIIGGISRTALQQRYSPSHAVIAQGALAIERVEKAAMQKKSPYGLVKASRKSTEKTVQEKAKSIVLNEDLMKIRQSELIILKEEEKFGSMSRDPDDRLVSKVQAETRLAEIELQKDNRRNIADPSITNKFAPHASGSDIGVVADVWLPDETKPVNKNRESAFLDIVDEEVTGKKRGEGKFGGQLAPIDPKGVETRIRKPIRNNVGSQVEFKRYRRKRELNDRLAEIEELKTKINIEKEHLMRMENKMNSRGSTRGGTASRGGSSEKQLMSKSMSGPLMSRQTTPMSRTVTPGFADDQGIQESKKDAPLSEQVSDTDIQNLSKEQTLLKQELDHIVHIEETMLDIKEQDRVFYGQERSREIERKRRLLTKEEGIRKGPPPQESQNAYDFYAIKCQSVIRGWLARCFVRWYRVASLKACRAIQAAMRGKLGRLKVAKRRVTFYAATQITKVYRGYKARGVSAALSANRNIGKSALIIQRMLRGHLGRMRAKSKRSLDNAAAVARDAVDPRALLASDVRELGRRIAMALEEPETTAFPPDEVLHLVRLATVILQQSRGTMGISSYSYINARYYGEVEGATMTWDESSKMLSRAERMIRLIRTMAFGPGEKPPRLIQISPEAQVLYGAQLSNPRWRVETFENMGMGSKFCKQLFLWIISVIEVSRRQREFDTFLTSSFPDWLPVLYDIQATQRKCEFMKEFHNRSIQKIEENQVRFNDALLSKYMEFDKKEHREKIELEEKEMAEMIEKESSLCTDQVKREDFAILSMEDRYVQMEEEADEYQREFLEASQLAQTGNTKAQEDLPELRRRVQQHDMSMKSLDAQLRLLKAQCDMNKSRRLESMSLQVEARVKAAAAGEAYANEVLMKAKMKVFLDEQGVRHAEDLEKEHQPLYEGLSQSKVEAHGEYWKIMTKAEEVRKEFDTSLSDQLLESQKREIESKDKVRPSDEELEEERREDEEQAKMERLKKIQYIPDAVINHPHPKRPRPVVIAIDRTTPGHVKRKIREETSRIMPGLFVYLDQPNNMGLSVRAMQAVLDAEKCIIMMVDAGSTRQTRMNFTKAFEVSLRALIPNPYVVCVIGDERNCRNGSDHYGCDATDLTNMRDRDIKMALEDMSWVVKEFSDPDNQKMMVKRAEDLEAPSQTFVQVAEAFFVCQSDIHNIRAPEGNMITMSWRFVRRLMNEPTKIVASLKQQRRGRANMGFIQCLVEYVRSQWWPVLNSVERNEDPLMHMMALYVEQYIVCERATFDRGGLPVQVIAKGNGVGIQAMEVAADSQDPDDLTSAPDSHGWRMTLGKIVRIALQDMRTIKAVMKIDGRLLNVGVYREENYIYFDTYDPKTSEVHICSIPKGEIPFLLMPNGQIMEEQGGRPAAPTTKEALYKELCNLLTFERVDRTRADSRVRLTCKRNYSFLRNLTLTMNGHPVFIKCFEAALGQLYFTAYMQETGALLSYLLEERTRLALIVNADQALEWKYVEESDARKILQICIDRLIIYPNKTMVKCGRDSIFVPNMFVKKGRTLADMKALGYRLKVRCRGGPGRPIIRRLVTFTDVLHILEVRLFSLDKMLIVNAYDPKKRLKMQYRIPFFLRKLLLGTNSDDPKVWIDTLTKRLKMNWRGKRSLYLDMQVYRSVRKIHDKRMLMKFDIESEDSLKVTVTDVDISATFEGIITTKQIIDTLLFKQVNDVIKKDFGVDVKKHAIRQILNEMARGPTSLPGESKGEGEEVDNRVYETSLSDIVLQKRLLEYLAKQLEILMKRIRDNSYFYGYHITRPHKIEFIPPPRSELKEAVDTASRYETSLKQSERRGDLEGVTRNRRQVPVLDMESELNALALLLSKRAKEQAEADRLAAEAFEKQLLGIVDTDIYGLTEPDEDGKQLTVNKKEHLVVEGFDDKQFKMDWEVDEEERKREEEEAANDPTGELAKKLKEKREKEKQKLAIAEAAAAASIAAAEASTDPNNVEGGEAESKEPGESPSKSEALGEGGESEDVGDDNVSTSTFNLQATIDAALSMTKDQMLGTIEEAHQKRAIERAQPGNTQEVLHMQMKQAAEEAAKRPPQAPLEEPKRSILGFEERKVFEGGTKTTFRDTKNSWNGHVAITVSEQSVWTDAEGIGKQFRFDVYEPGTATTYTGFIRDMKHLRQILGKNGKDLELPQKTTEMILFVAKFRMLVVDNRTTWDGEPNDDPDAPRYRIEFEIIRTYTEDKITPVNVGGDADAQANKDKLIEAEKARGKKINRIVRRVNGVLMQLTTFEINTSAEQKEALKEVMDDVPRGSTEEETAIPVWEAPTLKIIGYDPRSKKKSTYIAPPQAVLEVAGGVHSPYLDPNRRKELAKIAAESLALSFPKDKPFQLVMQWSGSSKEFTTATLATNKNKRKGTTRAPADAILNRTGKLFRTAMVVGRVDCVVTFYSQVVQGSNSNASGYVEKQLIANFYSRAAAEATEIVVSDQEQTERIGRTIASFPEGELRAAAVRRLLRFFHCDVIPDLSSDDIDRKILHVVLRPPGKDFLTEYMASKPTPPGDDIRPVGIPAVFLPLDTCGQMLHRCSMKIANVTHRDKAPLDYLISVYTKSEREGAERGLVIKFYERDTSTTFILHIGAGVLQELCERDNEPTLIREMAMAVTKANAEIQDEVESEFEAITEKGALKNMAGKLINHLVQIVLADIILIDGADDLPIPYLKSKGKGLVPMN